MAITKMTADAIKARPSRRNRAKIEATTEDDIRGQMIEDGENPDEEVFGLVAKLRNWEQNRVAMEPATIALMRILAREPEAALRALRRRAA